MKEQCRTYKCNLALKKGFEYNSATGAVKTPTGKIASKKTKNGYIMLTVRDENKKAYYLLAHHFAWYFENKDMVSMIDHINEVKTDNRMVNLRATNKQINALNTSKSLGAYLCRKTGRYESKIMIDNKSIYLGKFDLKKDAENKYKEYKQNKIKELCSYKG